MNDVTVKTSSVRRATLEAGHGTNQPDIHEGEKEYIAELENQILLIRLEKGDKLAAKVLIGELGVRVRENRLSAFDMIRIWEILRNIYKMDLAHVILGKHKPGRTSRNPLKCVEIYSEVMKAKEKYGIPIKSEAKVDAGEHDALSRVAQDREKRRALPWQYRTVQKYYDDGRRYLEISHQKVQDSVMRWKRILEGQNEDITVV